MNLSREFLLSSALGMVDAFVFAKDLEGRYTYCNEALAEVADLDSPEEIVGKRDFDLVWRDQANLFRKGDVDTLEHKSFIKVPEIQIQATGVKKILTTKKVLKDKSGHVCGVGGFFVDAKANYNPVQLEDGSARYFLPLIGDIELMDVEIQMLRGVSLGWSRSKIRKQMGLNYKDANILMLRLSKKMCCSCVSELHWKLVASGLIHLIF